MGSCTSGVLHSTHSGRKGCRFGGSVLGPHLVSSGPPDPGITPGRARGAPWDAGTEPRSGHMQGQYPPRLSPLAAVLIVRIKYRATHIFWMPGWKSSQERPHPVASIRLFFCFFAVLGAAPGVPRVFPGSALGMLPPAGLAALPWGGAVFRH